MNCDPPAFGRHAPGRRGYSAYRDEQSSVTFRMAKESGNQRDCGGTRECQEVSIHEGPHGLCGSFRLGVGPRRSNPHDPLEQKVNEPPSSPNGSQDGTKKQCNTKKCNRRTNAQPDYHHKCQVTEEPLRSESYDVKALRQWHDTLKEDNRPDIQRHLWQSSLKSRNYGRVFQEEDFSLPGLPRPKKRRTERHPRKQNAFHQAEGTRNTN